MRHQRNHFRSLADASIPSVWTWIIPVLTGTAVYFGFAEKLELPDSHIVWWEELLGVAPALLLGLLFQVFVLLPLRVLFARGQMNSPLLFLAISSLIWIAAGATILFGTNTLPQGDLWVDASVIVPGCVIAVAFTLMNLGKRATAVSSPTEP
jgi:hypothetical protein